MKRSNLNRSILLAVAGLFALCLSACNDSVSGTTDEGSSVSETSSSSVERFSSSSKQLSELERATANFDAVEDGVIRFAEGDSTKGYVYDDGSWRYANASEMNIGTACVKMTDGKYASNARRDYLCKWSNVPAWKEVPVFEIPKENYFNKDIEYGTVEDNRDGHVYKTVEIRGAIWMAENLTYFVESADCRDSLTVGCKYKWETALALENGDSIADVHQGICMDGWHVPDTSEWNSVLQSNVYTDLYSQTGWQIGENGTGLSIVPSVMEGYALLVAANKDAPESFKNDPYFVYQYLVLFDRNMFKYISGSEERGTTGPMYVADLRCVKDSE